ncbi:hypothetical protein [Synechococcus phage S-N03]|uniref:Uncharacterized protein n=1 Tax=Synechococcus phage S-N03 TaxID=2718943 RepID=A0A6G8R5S1_9CAUD|nr:hypothetical protein PQC09_gp101 [Synechococcus phage S-N03]QIN96736.1 hypothetical protein [Synechococcus phage S-N03]
MKRLFEFVQRKTLPGVQDRTLLRIRWFGSGLLILSHFIILYLSVPVGVSVMLFSDFICLPYAIRKGYWDIVAVISIYTIINVVRLLTLGL